MFGFVCRVLFQIQTAQWWQNVLIWANLIHAGLIAFEAQNWTVSWVNPDLDPIWVKVTEVICIILYSTDALMKMNYFGGWCVPSLTSELVVRERSQWRELENLTDLACERAGKSQFQSEEWHLSASG